MPTTLDYSHLPDPFETTRSRIKFWDVSMPDENYADDQTAFVRRWMCLSTDRLDFVQDVLGGSTFYASSNYIHRDLPQEDFEMPGFYAVDMRMIRAAGSAVILGSNMYPSNVDRSEPKSGSTLTFSDVETWSAGLHEYAIAFRRPVWTVKADEDVSSATVPELERFIFRTTEDAIESENIATNYLRFKGYPPGSSLAEVPATGSKPFPSAVRRYALKMWPPEAEPYQTIRNTLGKINNATFDSKYPPGTLLMMAPQRRIYQHANTALMQDIDFTFQERPQGWNFFFHPTTGEYVEVERKSDPSIGAFETADFNLLFDPSQS